MEPPPQSVSLQQVLFNNGMKMLTKENQESNILSFLPISTAESIARKWYYETIKDIFRVKKVNNKKSITIDNYPLIDIPPELIKGLKKYHKEYFNIFQEVWEELSNSLQQIKTTSAFNDLEIHYYYLMYDVLIELFIPSLEKIIEPHLRFNKIIANNIKSKPKLKTYNYNVKKYLRTNFKVIIQDGTTDLKIKKHTDNMVRKSNVKIIDDLTLPYLVVLSKDKLKSDIHLHLKLYKAGLSAGLLDLSKYNNNLIVSDDATEFDKYAEEVKNFIKKNCDIKTESIKNISYQFELVYQLNKNKHTGHLRKNTFYDKVLDKIRIEIPVLKNIDFEKLYREGRKVASKIKKEYNII
jgi:hypothetical protein